jgi:hypothetical protein
MCSRRVIIGLVSSCTGKATVRAVWWTAVGWRCQSTHAGDGLVELATEVRRVETDMLDEAFYLLEQFLRQEKFDTPTEAMHSSLHAQRKPIVTSYRTSLEETSDEYWSIHG